MRAGAAAGLVAGAVALLLAGSAPAAGYAPSLIVSTTTSAYSASGSTTVQVVEAETDDPLAKVDVRVPAGYGVVLSQPFGSTLGMIDVRGKTEPVEADLHLVGPLRTADPSAYAQAAASCTGQSAHDSVWVASPGGGLAPIPVFADRAPARVQLCLPQPGAPGFAARLFRVSITVTGVFQNPGTGGVYRWSGLLDPYPTQPGTAQVQSQTIVRLPPHLTLTRTLIVANHRTFIRLSGRLTERGQAVAGTRVEILSGSSSSSLTRFAFTTTFGKGKFEVVAPLWQATLFRATANVAARAAPVAACVPISGSLAPCTSVSLAPFSASSKIVRARPAIK